jgi:hypothetical protein
LENEFVSKRLEEQGVFRKVYCSWIEANKGPGRNGSTVDKYAVAVDRRLFLLKTKWTRQVSTTGIAVVED